MALECKLSNQTTWENGVVVKEAMMELIGRFPSRDGDRKKPKGCQRWRESNLANQLQICTRKDDDGNIDCEALHELIFQACRGILDPNFGQIKVASDHFFNRTYRVVTIVDEPFVFKDVDKDGKVTWSGFSIDLLKILAERINFNYEIFESTDYGSFRPTGPNGTMEWSGLVGDVVSGRADFAVSAMTVTPQREMVVDFTKRYMDYAVGILMKKKPAVSNLFS